MTMADLTAQTVAVLMPAMPVLASIGEGFANEIGKEGYQHAQALLKTIKEWFQRTPDAKAEKALRNFEDDPETYVDAFAKQFERYLADHPQYATHMTETLADSNLLEIIATNNALVEKIKMELVGGGTSRITADNSIVSDVVMINKPK